MMHERHPLTGRSLATGDTGKIRIEPAVDCARFSLRISPAHLAEVGKAFGGDMPSQIGTMETSEERAAVCIGPDEWYLLAPVSDLERIETAFAELYDTAPHSLVDVSHREVGIEITGASAVLALQSAIAFDVKAMRPGHGCRTMFDKAQILLMRQGDDRFRIEVWRSFASHVWGILEVASREIHLDI